MRAMFEFDEDTPERLTIRDVGGPNHMSVTNDAEAIVRVLAERVGNRRLFYYDSEGRLDELLIRDGKFAGFRAGGPSDGKP